MTSAPIKLPHIPAYGLEVETSEGPVRILVASLVTRIDYGQGNTLYFSTEALQSLLSDADAYIGDTIRDAQRAQEEEYWDSYLAELRDEVEAEQANEAEEGAEPDTVVSEPAEEPQEDVVSEPLPDVEEPVEEELPPVDEEAPVAEQPPLEDPWEEPVDEELVAEEPGLVVEEATPEPVVVNDPLLREPVLIEEQLLLAPAPTDEEPVDEEQQRNSDEQRQAEAKDPTLAGQEEGDKV
jgi:collagen type V/XI/XXIV/XXVII alpha